MFPLAVAPSGGMRTHTSVISTNKVAQYAMRRASCMASSACIRPHRLAFSFTRKHKHLCLPEQQKLYKVCAVQYTDITMDP